MWRCAALWIRLSTRLPVFGAASISLAEEKEAIVFWLPCIICSFEGFSNLAHTPESGHRHRKSGYVNNHSQNMVEYVICYCFFFSLASVWGHANVSNDDENGGPTPSKHAHGIVFQLWRVSPLLGRWPPILLSTEHYIQSVTNTQKLKLWRGKCALCVAMPLRLFGGGTTQVWNDHRNKK